MAQQGGYRQPSNPAPVSGPGALSKRTDGGPIDGLKPSTQAPKYMPGLGYGKGGENMANEQSATFKLLLQCPLAPLQCVLTSLSQQGWTLVPVLAQKPFKSLIWLYRHHTLFVLLPRMTQLAMQSCYTRRCLVEVCSVN